MAFVYILIGLLLVLPGNLSKRVESYRTEEEYAELMRKLRFLARESSWPLYEQQHVNSLNPKWKEVVDTDKRIEKNVLNEDVKLDVKEAVKDDITTEKVPLTTKAPSNVLPPNPLPQVQNKDNNEGFNNIIGGSDALFIAIVVACSLAGFVGLLVAGVCWYKLNKNIKAASEVDYPAYGVTGPTKERLGSGPGDRKLAQSAQMYHYQHQKQQMIAMEKANGEMKHDASEDESEEENEEGDYTVYECPGLAPTGEMEVRNPLFNEETPVSNKPGEDQKDTQ